MWLIASLENKGLEQKKDPLGLPSYGHANAADWLDESVATHCEIDEIEKSRISDPFHATALRKFIQQENPVFVQLKEQIKLALENSNGKQIVIKEETDDESFKVFYQQASWLRYFLLDRIGNSAYKNIVNKLANNEDINDYLLTSLKYENWNEVDKEFTRFVSTHLANKTM